MERVNDQQTRLDEQFKRQMATPQTLNEVERLLRDSRESFEQVRITSPTRFRFRVVNREGQDIRDIPYEQKSQNQQNDQRAPGKSESDNCSMSSESTRVEPTGSESTRIEPTSSEPTGVEPTSSEPTRAEPTNSKSTCVEHPFVDQWWEGIRNSIRTDWPGVEEVAGHYCIV